MKKNNQLKIFSLSSSLSHLEWLSLLGDKFRDAAEFEAVETQSLDEANVIVWDGIAGPKSRGLVETLRPYLDRGIPLVITGEGRAFVDESLVAEVLGSQDWKSLVLPPWGSLPEDLALGLRDLLIGGRHV